MTETLSHSNIAVVGEQYLCRRPTLLLHTPPDENESEPPFGPDCFAFDLPIELVYGSETLEAPLYHMPSPSDAIVPLLLAAIALAEVRECVEEHGDPRGLLFFDRGVTESLGGTLDYASATERLEPTGFWIAKPTSAARLVAELEGALPPDVAARAAIERARYPVQYAADARWLDGLWRFVAEYQRKRERERPLDPSASGRRAFQY